MTDYLRNVSTIATTSIGVAVAQIAADNPHGSKLLSTAQGLISKATADFSTMAAGRAAAVSFYAWALVLEGIAQAPQLSPE